MIQNKSLKSQISLIILAFSSAAILIGLVIAFRFYQTVSEDKVSLLNSISENIADKIDRNLFERYGDVQAFSVSEPAQRMDLPRLDHFIATMMTIYSPVYDYMIVADLNGRIVAVNTVDKSGAAIETKKLIGSDVSKEAWYQKAIKGEIAPATSFVEDPKADSLIQELLGVKKRYMNFTSPIRDSKGNIIGVWSNRASWEDVVESMLKEESAKVKNDHIESVAAVLLSSAGRVLSAPSGYHKSVGDAVKPQELLQQSGYVVVASSSKGFASYPSQGWKLAVQTSTQDRVWDQVKWLLVASLLTLIGINIFVQKYLSQLVERFVKISSNLSQEAVKLRKFASTIQESSHSFSGQVSEQASAIEETVASMEEMTSMLNQTSGQAQMSLKTSEESYQASVESQKTFNQMASSMQEIQASNRKLDQIISLIEEIKSKTKIINDIVFETRLLSFNASIEAARAGTHGKGFAVVAEEVGKLALMSGKAADEIQNLLENSTSEVRQVVLEVNEKVKSGKVVADRCEDEFEKVGHSLQKISESARMIAHAVREQETGVRQTNAAMNSIEQVVQQNSGGAEKLARQGESLLQLAENLNQAMGQLNRIVQGESAEISLDSPPPSA